MRQMTAPGIAFTERWEGIVPYVYDDAISPTRKWVKGTDVRGNLTAGVGHLLSADEAKQWTGKPIPKTVIDAWFDADNNAAEHAVDSLVKVRLSDNQFNALVDLTFNIGAGPKGFSGSTLLRKLNAGDYASVSGELMKWTKTKINGVRVNSAGLQARRAAEGVMFNSTAIMLPPPAKPRTIAQPMATEAAVPGAKDWSPTEIVGAGGTVATVAAAGFSTQGVLMYVFAGILVLAVLAIGALAIKRYWFRS